MSASIEEAMQELFAPLTRRAPGSGASTAQALSMVPQLGARRRVIELGCGEGLVTVQLAAALPDARIVAVDLDAGAIARLRARVDAEGLGDRVETRALDMRELVGGGHAVGDAQLLWAEGSLYTIGLSEGLELCASLLEPEGVVVFTELVWLGEPGGAEAFWADAYPQMRTREGVEAELGRCGLASLGSFVLPRSDWNLYYDPLRARLDALGDRDDAGMREAIAMLRAEIEVFDQWGERYGYACWVARRRGYV